MTATTSTARQLPTARSRSSSGSASAPASWPRHEPDLWPRRRLVVVPEVREDVAVPPAPTRPAPAARPAPDSRQLPPSVYRRRRLVVATAAVAVVAGLLTAARPVPAAPPADGAVSAVASVEPLARTVTLVPGETLWDVAVAHAPSGTDPRAYLAQLRDLNGFDGSQVPAWTVMLLPDVRRPD